jgi:hypothetical protein
VCGEINALRFMMAIWLYTCTRSTKFSQCKVTVPSGVMILCCFVFGASRQPRPLIILDSSRVRPHTREDGGAYMLNRVRYTC